MLTGGDFPGVAAARSRSLERVRTVLDAEKTDELLARGAAMSYDELAQYAIRSVEPAGVHDEHEESG